MQNQIAKTKFYKNISKFLEFLIWGSIFTIIILVIVSYNSYCHKNYSRYQIFLQDVDGIIVGSPVKMMGIQVGYVKHIKFINDLVYVDFVINQEGIEIPKGSKITVEFSGLGGSRSLEIYTPKEKYNENTPPIVIQQPQRLGASVSLLNQMFKKICDIVYRCTYFGEKLEFSSNKQEINQNKKIEKSFLYEVNKWLDKQNSRK